MVDRGFDHRTSSTGLYSEGIVVVCHFPASVRAAELARSLSRAQLLEQRLRFLQWALERLKKPFTSIRFDENRAATNAVLPRYAEMRSYAGSPSEQRSSVQSNLKILSALSRR